jgi:LacI family transcriptional regulator
MLDELKTDTLEYKTSQNVSGYERRGMSGALGKAANGRATIGEVAELAGVSTGTVSRVLNNRRGVHARTRQAVLSAIASLEYRPDQAARELSFRQTTKVGLSVGLGSRRLIPFFMLFLEYLITELQADGYRLEEIATRKDGLPERLTDAMILFGAHDDDPRIHYLQKEKIPFVLVGHYEGTRWVMPDDYNGGLEATRHLLRLGHKEILHVSGIMTNQTFHDRYQGYLDALKEAGLKPKREWLLDGDFTTLAAYRVVRKRYEKGSKASAIFAASDEMALGVIAALEDVGLNVPLDVSVVGFDDLPEMSEKLTTVRQDIQALAARAVALLKEGLRGEVMRHELIPVQLMVRGTTARKRG